MFNIKINKEINKLIAYGLDRNMIEKEDEVYVRNRILALLHLEEYEKDNDFDKIVISDVIENILKYALENKIIKKDINSLRDIFDSRLMNQLMKRPSEVNKDFYSLYNIHPKEATNWFYDLNKNSNYIRTDRIAKNMKWKTKSKYGDIDITINLSKPEKTPEEIIMASKATDSNYPKCFLCKENEGYEGRIDHPGRANHRIIPIKLVDEDWFFQYSPYSYFNEHSIVFKGSHDPMKINHKTFKRLLDFIEMFPHYFLGSNADLPIVGGSILSHDHFQGGNYKFAIQSANKLYSTTLDNYPNVDLSIIDWPMSVIRISSSKKEKLAEVADYISKKWKNYSDESVNIIANTDEEHNTITPIARFNNNKFEIDLVLRNNRRSDKHPMGIFHPHNDVFHIKKENIGLIEVMGLAVLPKRLKKEISKICEVLLFNKDISEDLKIHTDWINLMKKNYSFTNKEETLEIVKKEVGDIFVKVLEYAGVYKRDEEGFNAFVKFIKYLKK